MKKIVIGATAALLCLHSAAEFYTGNKLLSLLRGDTLDQIHASGYIIGVFDAGCTVTHCSPSNITAGQITDMVKQHLESVPGARHLTGDQHVIYVLQKAWPCAEKKPGNNGRNSA